MDGKPPRRSRPWCWRRRPTWSPSTGRPPAARPPTLRRRIPTAAARPATRARQRRPPRPPGRPRPRRTARAPPLAAGYRGGVSRRTSFVLGTAAMTVALAVLGLVHIVQASFPFPPSARPAAAAAGPRPGGGVLHRPARPLGPAAVRGRLHPRQHPGRRGRGRAGRQGGCGSPGGAAWLAGAARTGRPGRLPGPAGRAVAAGLRDGGRRGGRRLRPCAGRRPQPAGARPGPGPGQRARPDPAELLRAAVGAAGLLATGFAIRRLTGGIGDAGGQPLARPAGAAPVRPAPLPAAGDDPAAWEIAGLTPR